jgi:hypothetical protein
LGSPKSEADRDAALLPAGNRAGDRHPVIRPLARSPRGALPFALRPWAARKRHFPTSSRSLLKALRDRRGPYTKGRKRPLRRAGHLRSGRQIPRLKTFLPPGYAPEQGMRVEEPARQAFTAVCLPRFGREVQAERHERSAISPKRSLRESPIRVPLEVGSRRAAAPNCRDTVGEVKTEVKPQPSAQADKRLPPAVPEAGEPRRD